MLRLWLGALALLFLTLPGIAQEWSKSRLDLIPGEGMGDVKLGGSVPDSTLKYLGEPTHRQAAGDERASGYLLWGQGDNRNLKQGLLLRLGDGSNPQAVVSIVVRGVRASTDKGVYLGAGDGLVRKRYPQAQLDLNSVTRQKEWVIPGLTLRMEKDKVVEMEVEPTDLTRWRFAPMKVVPGVSAGPMVLGKPVPAEVFNLLGPPMVQQKAKGEPGSGLLRWSTPGQNPNRLIEVLLHDGVNPQAVSSIRLRGVLASTDKVRLGDSLTMVKETYTQGRQGLAAQPGAETWRIPGLNFVLQRQRLTEMQLFSTAPPKTR